jgi:bile acid-coenzyme A ligase
MNSPGKSYGRRLAELAEERPDDLALRFVLLDGEEPAFTWSELRDRSSRLAATLAARGLALGDRLALSLRNTPEFVLAALAAWKLGAVPVPVRWDLPDWELARVREVIDPKVHLGPSDIPWIRATADDPVPELPDAVAPQRFGICSSGSTGTPKVILPGEPGLYDETVRPGVAADPAPRDHHGAGAAVPHQRVLHADEPAGRRPARHPGEV